MERVDQSRRAGVLANRRSVGTCLRMRVPAGDRPGDQRAPKRNKGTAATHKFMATKSARAPRWGTTWIRLKVVAPIGSTA